MNRKILLNKNETVNIFLGIMQNLRKIPNNNYDIGVDMNALLQSKSLIESTD